jgi:hypothetical protein
MVRLISFLGVMLIYTNVNAQDWVRIYGQGLNAVPRHVVSDYDKGFIILGDINYKFSWIIKTDVNGIILHNMRLGSGGYTVGSANIERTLDDGYILCGSWTKFNTSFDAFIIKLNSCYEVEWCKTLITPTNYDMGMRVKQTPEGDYLLLGAYFATIPISNTSLFKFNSSGDLIWHQYYPMDSIYYDDQPTDLVIDNNGSLIITRRYFPDPGQTGGGVLRSNYIFADTAGIELWNTVYVDNGYYYSRPGATKKNQFGHYYTVCTHTIYSSGDNPALLKVLGNGNQSYNHDIITTGTFFLSGMNTIDILIDTNFVMAGGWKIGNAVDHVIIKTDTLANLQKTKILPSITNTYVSTAKTTDNKFLTVGNDAIDGTWKIYAVKVNSDLEYDSIYTNPFTYDSLCPHAIVSDTIDPDCENVYVGVEEPFKSPETTRLKIWPNPARDRITIEMPKYLVVSNTTSTIPSTTVYHQWGTVKLEVYNLNGLMVYEREVPRAEKDVSLDVSTWTKGMYFFRLVYNKQSVAGEKVIVK